MQTVRHGRIRAARARAAGAALALTTILGGCATAPGEVARNPGPPVALLAVRNLSPYPWRVEVRSLEGGPTAVETVPSRATATMSVPAGRVEIDQCMLGAAAMAAARRTLTVEFAAGEQYDWTLATLLTSGDEAAVSGAGTASHEGQDASARPASGGEGSPR